MRYSELEKISEQRWITEGPNREGVSGFLLVEDSVYFFYEEPGMSEPNVVSKEDAKAFVLENDGKVGAKIQAVVDYLKGRNDR